MIKINPLPKARIILPVAGVVLIGIFVIAWLYFSRPAENVEIETPEQIQEVVSESHIMAISQAEEGNVEAAFREYDKAINEEQNNEVKKGELLLQKATLAQRSGKYDDAINAAKQAEGIAPPEVTSQILAAAYEMNGDKENAIIYYRRLIEQTPQESAGSGYTGIWEAKIRELQQ